MVEQLNQKKGIKKMPKPNAISIYMTPALKERTRAAAQAMEIDMSSFIRLTIAEKLKNVEAVEFN